MWDFFETVRHRHSVRKYQPDMAVEPEKLYAILEMACAAPSAGDLQAYRIVVVRDLADRQALVRASHQQDFITEAPVCLAVSYTHLDVYKRQAASIARRLQDPLAELVKIDPKSIGVGQYQHDVNQAAMALSLIHI